jgi:DNA-binding PucR family transcriptional regulator
MSERSATDIADQVRELGLDPPVIAALRAQLPSVAQRTIAAVTAEVPQYADGLSEEMGAGIAAGVQMALAAFFRLAAGPRDQDPDAALDAALDGAYRLGRMEARSGRTMDALLSAYRVGARVAWHDQAATAVAHGVPSASIAAFAALVFAYIDELSAASVAGHRAELGASERVRARHLAELGQALLAGEATDVLLARAERAEWHPPETLTAVLLPAARLHEAASVLDQRTLVITDDLTGGAIPGQTGGLLVPDAARTRSALLRLLQGRSAIVGPARPWTLAASSFHRAVRAVGFAPPEQGAPVDTDRHLVELVLRADPSALADLREQALGPLAGLRPATAERLAATLRSWLLHRGRRGAVADDLMVHPQTVRYRMTQLRELYGDDLDDPEAVLRLTVALAFEVDALPPERR